MSGTLHGQSWATAIGLGLLLPAEKVRSVYVLWKKRTQARNRGAFLPRMLCVQIAAHVAAEIALNCGSLPNSTTACGVGLLALPLLPGDSSWAVHASPSMSMDATAAAVTVHGISALNDSPAAAVAAIYRDTLHDMWNWHDLHVGPSGLACGGAQVSGNQLIGTPFVNAHYARQLQVWAVQV